MFKKIMMLLGYAAIVGLLVFGAANRTAAKTDQGSLIGGSNEIANEGRRGNGGLGNETLLSQVDSTDHTENSEEHDFLNSSGTILVVDNKTLEIQDQSAEIYVISGRPWRFAQELGFFPSVGNEVTMEGFYENGEFIISTIYDLSTGEIIELRDDSGHPLWSGSGS